MTVAPLARTAYWNLGNGTVRTGATTRAESVTDVESYFLPLDRASNRTWQAWGVAEGLTLAATSGQAEVTVGTGVGLDVHGRLTVLAAGSLVVVDQTVDPDEMVNVSTVVMPETGGVVLETAGFSGDHYVTVTWREVRGTGTVANAPVLLQAPWVRFIPVADLVNDGTQVVLGQVSLDVDGKVTSVTPSGRRVASLRGGGSPCLRRDLPVPPPVLWARSHRRSYDHAVAVASKCPYPVAGAPRQILSADGLGNLAIGGPTTIGDLAAGGSSGRSGLRVTGDAVVGAGNDGLLTVRRISGKDSQSDAVDDLFLNFDTGRDVQVGSSITPATLRVHGDLRVEATVHASQWNLPAGGTIGAAGRLHITGDETLYLLNRSGVVVAKESGGSGTLTVQGALQAVGGLQFSAGGTIGAAGRLHVTGDEILYLLNRSGVIVGKEWGGSGTLTVEGALQAVGGVKLAANGTIGAPGRLHIAGDEILFLLNRNGVVVGKGWGGNGNLTVEGGLQVGPSIQLPAHGTIGAPGRLHIAGDEILYLLNRNGVVVGTGWGGNGNLAVEGHQLRVGSHGLPGWSGGGVIAFDVFARGGIYVGDDPENPKGAIWNNGTMSATLKRFVIDHPIDPDHCTLAHACIEGPESAVYYRGEGRLVDGWAQVDLPDYFERLARAEGRTVMVTPVSSIDEPISALAATPVCSGAFAVHSADKHNPKQRFCWEVKGVRADIDPLEVVTTKVG